MAEARGDGPAACDALTTLCGAQAVLGEADVALSWLDEAIVLAEVSGDVVMQANVVTVTASIYMSSDPPEYTAALRFLEGHPVAIPHDQISGIWVDTLWATALRGAGRPDAIRNAARARFATPTAATHLGCWPSPCDRLL